MDKWLRDIKAGTQHDEEIVMYADDVVVITNSPTDMQESTNDGITRWSQMEWK